MFGPGTKTSITLKELLAEVSEPEILAHYLGITKIPCIISSPLRSDQHPSFGIFSLDGIHVYYTDLATKENGGTFELLGRMWGTQFPDTLDKVYKDIVGNKQHSVSSKALLPKVNTSKITDSDSTLEVKVREWQKHDIEYWESYGITLVWLQYAEIYPVSHIIITKGGNRRVFGADKYAYVYVEHKEGKDTYKVYQPYNTNGFKWRNKHDRSVISLWTKIPETGDKVCICSSMKDALCLSCNLMIPAIALQGEGYGISDTAANELRRRYKEVLICLDNDKWGIEDSKKLAEKTGFRNIILPPVEGAKDISDIFKSLGKEEFVKQLKPLFYDS